MKRQTLLDWLDTKKWGIALVNTLQPEGETLKALAIGSGTWRVNANDA